MQYRQGDVLLIKLDRIPNAAKEHKKKDRIVLAYGERTGHAHALSTQTATAYSDGDDLFVDTQNGTILVHEEHTPLLIRAGQYRVIKQKEYVHKELETQELTDWDYMYMD